MPADGVAVGVIDAYSIKPIDPESLLAAGDRLVTVEDHWPEGGLGDAVLCGTRRSMAPTARVKKLAVTGMPRSGKPAELMKAAGIDADAIAAAVRELLSRSPRPTRGPGSAP